VKFLIQLKLSKDVKNHFAYCEIHIPFFNRGPILSYESTPSSGSIEVSPNKTELVWFLGKHFTTSRNLEVAMPATVKFHPPPSTFPPDNDPFCVGNNAYINVRFFFFVCLFFSFLSFFLIPLRSQIRFKITGDTVSGTNVEEKSITIFPSSKTQINIEKEISSDHYMIWNSLGNVKASQKYPQEEKK
jgi:AP-5 complex subunit mu-1